LLDHGAPLGGIGFQGHLGSLLTPPVKLLEILDKFAVFGVPLQVTEFDVDVADEQLAADFTRDLITVLFSHPAVNGFVMWGFWEGSHWKPHTAMFRRDWSPKLNGIAYMDLVCKQWRTDELLVSDAAGMAATRGFLGEYEITASHHGKTVTVRETLKKDNPVIRVELPI